MNELNSCTLCPRNCRVNRIEDSLGFCSASSKVRVARAALHHWEEPCISGSRGSGTVFFSHCNLKCVFCQNNNISTVGTGADISIERLSDIFLEQQARGAHNINLVTPSHYAPQIAEAIKLSENHGLRIPIVYNTNSYENTDTLKTLRGLVDIYLADLKYYDDKYAIKYSGAPNYFKHAAAAIEEMFQQVGAPVFDEEGIMRSGVIIRHLMLPGLLFDSKKIIDYIYSTYGDKVYISLMNQYTPNMDLEAYPELNKSLNPKHYNSLIDYCVELGVTKAFIQEEGTCSESFIPDFDLEGVFEKKY